MGCKTCQKTKVRYRKGLWSPDEDQKLRNYILMHGHGCWSSVPMKAGLQRNGKSCRLRWINYLRPGLKRGCFSPEEEATIIKLHALLGNKWSQIAMHLPGRTDNEVKNYWNSYLKKKVTKVERSNSHVSALNKHYSAYPRLRNFAEELNSQTSLSDSSENLKSSPLESFRSIQQANDHGTSQGTAFQLPSSRVVFADWLSMDYPIAQRQPLGDGGMSSEWSFNSNEEAISPESMQAAVPPAGDLIHGLGDANIFLEYQTQFEHVEQILEDNYYDLLLLGENGDSFGLNQIM